MKHYESFINKSSAFVSAIIYSQVSIQFLRCSVMDKENMLKKNVAKFAFYSLLPSNWPFTDKMVCVMTSSLKKKK